MTGSQWSESELRQLIKSATYLGFQEDVEFFTAELEELTKEK